MTEDEYVLGDLAEEQRSAFMTLLAVNGLPVSVAEDAFAMALDVAERDAGFALTLERSGTGEMLAVLLSAPFMTDAGFTDINTLVVWLMAFKPGSVEAGLPWSDLLDEFYYLASRRGYQRIICTAARSQEHFEFLDGDMWTVAAEGYGVCWYGRGRGEGLWSCTQYPDPENPSNRLAYFRLDDDDPDGSHVREVAPSVAEVDAVALPLFGLPDD